MNVLMIDNFDSFTYNLVHYLEGLGATVTVWKNNAIQLSEVANFDAIVLSPGPGLPHEAGLMPELIQKYAPTKKILGVCLGHQALTIYFGEKLFNLQTVYHGRSSTCKKVLDDVMFEGVPETFEVGKYHSWSVQKFMGDALEVIAIDQSTGEIAAFKHKHLPIRGVQFHPESIMTPFGKLMIENWLKKL